ncbi:hypothetical protein D3C86_1956550 [compost metagenome]
MLFLAGAATATGDVEGYGDQITDLEILDVAAFFDDLASNFMAEHQSYLSGRSTSHHMLIGSANICRYHS